MGYGKIFFNKYVKKVLEQDQTDVYMIQEINAWKYQKEEFGRAFLKQLLQGIEILIILKKRVGIIYDLRME